MYGGGGAMMLGASSSSSCGRRDGGAVDTQGGGDGEFDPAAAQTLYWRRVPVLVKRPDRDDRVESLTFRVLSGHARRGRNVRVSSRGLSGALEGSS
jgi:hypothetical protein